MDAGAFMALSKGSALSVDWCVWMHVHLCTACVSASVQYVLSLVLAHTHVGAGANRQESTPSNSTFFLTIRTQCHLNTVFRVFNSSLKILCALLDNVAQKFTSGFLNLNSDCF